MNTEENRGRITQAGAALEQAERLLLHNIGANTHLSACQQIQMELLSAVAQLLQVVEELARKGGQS